MEDDIALPTYNEASTPRPNQHQQNARSSGPLLASSTSRRSVATTHAQSTTNKLVLLLKDDRIVRQYAEANDEQELLYKLSHRLDLHSPLLSLSKEFPPDYSSAVPVTPDASKGNWKSNEGNEKLLYTLSRPPLVAANTIITGKRRSTHHSSDLIMTKSLCDGWKFYIETIQDGENDHNKRKTAKEVIFRCREGKHSRAWTDGNSHIIARETITRHHGAENIAICFEEKFLMGGDRQRDLMVACWCAKLWMEAVTVPLGPKTWRIKT